MLRYVQKLIGSFTFAAALAGCSSSCQERVPILPSSIELPSGLHFSPDSKLVLEDEVGNRFAGDRLLVQFRPDADLDDIHSVLQKANVDSISGHIPQLDIYELKILPPNSLTSVTRDLERSPAVLYVEKNFVVNPEEIKKDWADTALDHVKAQRILSAKGTLEEVIIGVLDIGFEVNHPFLSPRFYSRDGNFFDLAEGDFDIGGDDHGTEVSGVIARITTTAKITPTKIYSSQSNSGFVFKLAGGIVYQVMEGVDVINMSVSSPHSSTLENAVRYASDRGVLLVASAGNIQKNFQDTFPAAYDSVIAVGATQFKGGKERRATGWGSVTPGSNYPVNPEEWSHFIAAPGDDICTATGKDDWTCDFGGTSAAAPFVSGLAGLLKQFRVDTATIYDIMLETADKIVVDTPVQTDVEWKRINIASSLEKALVEPLLVEAEPLLISLNSSGFSIASSDDGVYIAWSKSGEGTWWRKEYQELYISLIQDNDTSTRLLRSIEGNLNDSSHPAGGAPESADITPSLFAKLGDNVLFTWTQNYVPPPSNAHDDYGGFRWPIKTNFILLSGFSLEGKIHEGPEIRDENVYFLVDPFLVKEGEGIDCYSSTPAFHISTDGQVDRFIKDDLGYLPLSFGKLPYRYDTEKNIGICRKGSFDYICSIENRKIVYKLKSPCPKSSSTYQMSTTNGNSYAVVCKDSTDEGNEGQFHEELNIIFLSKSGSQLSKILLATSPTASASHRLFLQDLRSTDFGYSFLWGRSRDRYSDSLFISEFDSSGNPLGTKEIRRDNFVHKAEFVWNGNEYGLAWNETDIRQPRKERKSSLHFVHFAR